MLMAPGTPPTPTSGAMWVQGTMPTIAIATTSIAMTMPQGMSAVATCQPHSPSQSVAASTRLDHRDAANDPGLLSVLRGPINPDLSSRSALTARERSGLVNDGQVFRYKRNDLDEFIEGSGRARRC